MSDAPEQSPGPPIAECTIGGFVRDLSAKSPTPGGGAAAGVAGATGAALLLMVVSYSEGKKSLAEHEALHADARVELGSTRDRLLALADADARAFEAFQAAMRLDDEDPDKPGKLADAAKDAADAPAEMLDLCARVIDLAEALAGKSSKMLVSDLLGSARIALGAAEAAAACVAVNLPSMTDADQAVYAQRSGAALGRAEAAAVRLGQACRV